MTQQEYYQKKRECWEEYKQANLVGEVQWQPVSRYDVFCDAFDRAFALGKQEKDGIDLKKLDKMLDDALKKETKESLNQWLSEKDADTVIQGWVARDSDGNLFMYSIKPERDEALQVWIGRCANCDMRNSLFPDLTWDSDPEPVEITIKRKKNGNNSTDNRI